MESRNGDIAALKKIYDRDDSSVVVMYGRTGIGKTSTALDFAKGKAFFYYRARNASEKMQLNFFSRELGLTVDEEELSDLSYEKLLKEKNIEM